MPVERERPRAPTVPSGAQPPQPVSQPVETNEESDTDDDDDGAPHGNMADEDDGAPHANMAGEDDDDFVEPADD